MRILLNTLKRDNYAFFDADSLACLDLQSPGCDVPKVTPAIRRGILAGTLIDVDGESGIKITEQQTRLQANYLRALGISPKVKVEAQVAPPVVEGKSAIDELNQAQVNDEKVAASKKKAANKKKDGEE